MGRKIQAYFKTENDALDVQTRLQAYGARQLEVSELPDGFGGNGRTKGTLLFPFAAAGTANHIAGGAGGLVGPGSSTTPASAPGALGAYAAARELDEDNHLEKRNVPDADGDNDLIGYTGDSDMDYDNLSHVLSADVNADEFESVIHLIRRHNGYVEVLD